MTDQFITLCGVALVTLASAPIVALLRWPAVEMWREWLDSQDARAGAG
jgi:hypothetical protein